MVLTYVKGWDNVPKNTKLLSEEEAFECQKKLVRNWEKPSEVFFLKYGSIIAGLATVLSSVPIVNHFRKQFKLKTLGVLMTYTPATAMPAALSYFGYEKLVTSEIMLMKMQCPLCMQAKYTAFHMFSSIFYSTIISALTCSSIAFVRHTRYVPPANTDTRLLLKLFWDVTKAGAQRYRTITLVQLVIVLFLPYLQVQEFGKFIESAAEKEKIKFGSQASDIVFE